MDIKGILIHPKDQVVTLVETAAKEDRIFYKKGEEIMEIQAKEGIPQYHKIAVSFIKKGSRIYKYGEEIGTAIQDIKPGEWVHTHNLKSSCLLHEKGQVAG